MAKLIQMKVKNENVFPKTWFPIGSIYENVNDLTIAQIQEFLYGTWERWEDGKGRVVIGVDESQSEFNSGGKKGGEKTHKLTEEELPLTYPEVYSGYRAADSDSKDAIAFHSQVNAKEYRENGSGGIKFIKFGGDKPHNNLQPYITTFKWIRVA